ncbi:MAG: crotonase/enoyl-CoA hydratase family protein [Gammaproteobacteria bacterium]|nr:crotonase/enoyl-CoA hydratase family protein [Gammaproteobacteria bacterium]MDH4314629.1 crotonase/enoyl-CoA hydratase family protein [Gammaproteobacteria bacterium]MDH5212865.1 crotonase/enoyl-CoA hydratase family protein [Gammaproteobacteria bacterium]MDH5499939.1 crotonase/enoyl-CoA hydratase family protein [Gammaproteobacteria bacterium]
MSERVLLTVKEHVAVVTLNRPEKKNAVDIETFEALIRAGETVAADRSVRAVVLHGAGGNFCAGIDISVFQGKDGGKEQNVAGGGRMKARDGSPANFFQSAAYVWHALPVPVIAAIEGYAFGAGLQIASGADIRYAEPAAKLSIMEIKWGIIPDMAMSVTLRNVMPLDRIRELAYSGRIISGQEALHAGLVTALHENPLDAACALAAEIAAKSPDAIRAIKELTSAGWAQPTADALRTEATLQLGLMGSPNQREAIAANMGDRKPVFRDAGS